MTDHMALEYFMTKQKLNARQARSAECLSWFNIKITYRPGCENRVADAFSCRSTSTGHDEVHNVIFLPRKMFTSEALADRNPAVVAAGGDETKDDEEQDEAEPGQDPVLELQAAISEVRQEMMKLRKLAKEGSPWCWVDTRGVFRIASKEYVPEVPLTLAALLICHVLEQPSIGRPGHNRMIRLLSARFHLKHLAQRVAKYLKHCPVCCKLARHTGPPPLFRPLPVPDAPWHDILGDFFRPLPASDTYNMLMVVVDWLTKMWHYISCTAKKTETEGHHLQWLSGSLTTYRSSIAPQRPSYQTGDHSSSVYSGNTSRPHSVSRANYRPHSTLRLMGRRNVLIKTSRTTYGDTSVETRRLGTLALSGKMCS